MNNYHFTTAGGPGQGAPRKLARKPGVEGNSRDQESVGHSPSDSFVTVSFEGTKLPSSEREAYFHL